MPKIHDITLAGTDSVLVHRASKVRFFDKTLKDLIQDMFLTMDAKRGVGLAAPQIGLPYQIAVVKPEGLVIINPKVVSAEGLRIMDEGCLSIPDVAGKVPRSRKLVFDAQDENGKHYRIKAEDNLLAHVCEHEIDHLFGVLFFHRIQKYHNRIKNAINSKGIAEKLLAARGEQGVSQPST